MPPARAPVPQLVAAFDKFRGTATAAAVSDAAVRAATSLGWRGLALRLADGGEGTLDAFEAAVSGADRPGASWRPWRRRSVVAGPLGEPVEAPWLLLPDTGRLPLPPPLVPGRDPTAVVEAAAAAGRALLPRPAGVDPLRASTCGVGELVLHALRAGARQVVVGVGGTATTDGGSGAVRVIASSGGLGEGCLVVAADVTTAFADAAATFGPQKGASAEQVDELRRRLDDLVARYLATYGVDVGGVPGAGAGGGLAGGLAALGATLLGGFELVARVVGLEQALAGADLLVTGEGRLDATSFSGKVVGGVLAACGGRPPALCVVGDAARGVERAWQDRPGRVVLVRLVDAVGTARSWDDPAGAVGEVVAMALANGGLREERREREQRG